jgi:CRP-like cAMP-binding protein
MHAFKYFLAEEGKSFGELALMSEDSVRNATVIADEETDLLVISRELFNRSMKVGKLFNQNSSTGP